ncbi:MAG: hypothetical protein ACR2HP_12575 [Ilumatobacteraceae bacterium]
MPKNPLRKLLDDSVALTEVSRKQAEDAVKSLVKAGEVRRSETEAVVQDLLDRGRRTATQLAETVQSEVAKQLGWLANRVDDLEDQLEGFVTRVVPRRAPDRAAAEPVLATKRAAAAATKTAPTKKRAAKKSTAKKSAATKSTAKKSAGGRGRKVATSRPT